MKLFSKKTALAGVAVTIAIVSYKSVDQPTNKLDANPIRPQSGHVYRSAIPERCAEIVNGGIAYREPFPVEYLFCRTPEGEYSRFQRPSNENPPSSWDEIVFTTKQP